MYMNIFFYCVWLTIWPYRFIYLFIVRDRAVCLPAFVAGKGKYEIVKVEIQIFSQA